MSNSKPWIILAPLCVVAAGVLWGIISIFIKQLSAAGLSPMQITETRCFLASIIMITICLATDKNRLRISLRDSWMFIGTGVISIALFNVFYFTCMETSTISVACILLYTSPVFITILSCLLFKERFTPRKAIAIVSALIGCAFVTGFLGGADVTSISGLAIITGLASGLCYGLYSIFGRFALAKYHPFTVTTYTFVFAAIALLPVSDFASLASMSVGNPSIATAEILLTIFSTVMPFMLYTQGLHHMETSKAGIIVAIEPVVASIVGTTVFLEPFGVNNALGIILVLFAVVLLSAPAKQKTVLENLDSGN